MAQNYVLLDYYAASSGDILPIITTTSYVITHKNTDL